LNLIAATVRALPTWLLLWLERRRPPLGERLADLACRRWRTGRRAHDHFIPF
jgi:hypothetical protein